MFKKIIIALVILIAGLLAYAATRPDTFHIERTAAIESKPEKVFALINDFHKWAMWSPWEKLDPEMKRTYGGAPKGNGSSYAWEGTKKVGSGRMEITESSAPLRVAIKIDFLKPFEAHNDIEFAMEGKTGSTLVTWAMNGKNTYLGKLMHIFFNMDKMVGKDFESGLANLKTIAEK